MELTVRDKMKLLSDQVLLNEIEGRFDGVIDVWEKIIADVLRPRNKQEILSMLNDKIKEADLILEKWRKAATIADKYFLEEQYRKLAKEISELKYSLSAIWTNKEVRKIQNVAAFFKSTIRKIDRNNKLYFRRIIKFLFKNMDDNSGDNIILSNAKNNIDNQCIHLYEKAA